MSSLPSPQYKSPYGPKYFYQTHVSGITTRAFIRGGLNAGFFGGVALGALIFYASGIPRIQKDIFLNVPVIGRYYPVKEVHPADNPF
ncbi:ubiquinol-cytochrome-c reductase complex subunit-domain-containing protein [Dichotomopilus funicola]|uniref:Ubiquinol-cytochrome-c reductase complex subunit-domain-containing protein n=1 Tax=Dichotomopilus funicola TaxID=1934379 RepID=A0AAN6UWU3_9PEZI|nr:ubiquinol-cytochrome-c reductase complex subunit-domain-containing protein [Dichotomopilus funicola]